MEEFKEYACLVNNYIKIGEFSVRPIQKEHIERIREWRNSQIKFLRQDKLISELEQINYFKRNVWIEMEKINPKNILLIFEKDKIPIGYGGLVHISWENKRSEISFLLDPIFLKNKKEYKINFLNFLKLIKTIAFKDLCLNKIFTETFSSRNSHLEILEESGFLREGKFKKHVKS